MQIKLPGEQQISSMVSRDEDAFYFHKTLEFGSPIGASNTVSYMATANIYDSDGRPVASRPGLSHDFVGTLQFDINTPGIQTIQITDPNSGKALGGYLQLSVGKQVSLRSQPALLMGLHSSSSAYPVNLPTTLAAASKYNSTVSESSATSNIGLTGASSYTDHQPFHPSHVDVPVPFVTDHHHDMQDTIITVVEVRSVPLGSASINGFVQIRIGSLQQITSVKPHVSSSFSFQEPIKMPVSLSGIKSGLVSLFHSVDPAVTNSLQEPHVSDEKLGSIRFDLEEGQGWTTLLDKNGDFAGEVYLHINLGSYPYGAISNEIDAAADATIAAVAATGVISNVPADAETKEIQLTFLKLSNLTLHAGKNPYIKIVVGGNMVGETKSAWKPGTEPETGEVLLATEETVTLHLPTHTQTGFMVLFDSQKVNDDHFRIGMGSFDLKDGEGWMALQPSMVEVYVHVNASGDFPYTSTGNISSNNLTTNQTATSNSSGNGKVQQIDILSARSAVPNENTTTTNISIATTPQAKPSPSPEKNKEPQQQQQQQSSPLPVPSSSSSASSSSSPGQKSPNNNNMTEVEWLRRQLEAANERIHALEKENATLKKSLEYKFATSGPVSAASTSTAATTMLTAQTTILGHSVALEPIGTNATTTSRQLPPAPPAAAKVIYSSATLPGGNPPATAGSTIIGATSTQIYRQANASDVKSLPPAQAQQHQQPTSQSMLPPQPPQQQHSRYQQPLPPTVPPRASRKQQFEQQQAGTGTTQAPQPVYYTNNNTTAATGPSTVGVSGILPSQQIGSIRASASSGAPASAPHSFLPMGSPRYYQQQPLQHAQPQQHQLPPQPQQQPLPSTSQQFIQQRRSHSVPAPVARLK